MEVAKHAAEKNKVRACAPLLAVQMCACAPCVAALPCLAHHRHLVLRWLAFKPLQVFAMNIAAPFICHAFKEPLMAAAPYWWVETKRAKGEMGGERATGRQRKHVHTHTHNLLFFFGGGATFACSGM